MKKQNATPKPQAQASLAAPTGSASTNVTQASLSAAFTEWDRRYREEPARFMSEAQHLLQETPETYGDACAPYLLKILAEQNPKTPEQIIAQYLADYQKRLKSLYKMWLNPERDIISRSDKHELAKAGLIEAPQP